MKNDTARYYVDWISMNFLGEQLLTLKRYDDALILCENNAKEFPDKDLVLCTLAKSYLELGMEKDAIIYFKKTLAINPGYEEAKSRLKELEGKAQKK